MSELTSAPQPVDPSPTRANGRRKPPFGWRKIAIVAIAVALVIGVSLAIFRPWEGGSAAEPRVTPSAIPTESPTPTPTPFQTPAPSPYTALTVDRPADTFAGWRVRTNAPEVALHASDDARSGNYALHVRSGAARGAISGQFEYPVTVPGGQPLVVSAWVKSLGVESGSVEIRPGIGWEPAIKIPGGTYDWQRVEVAVPAQGDVTSIRLVIQGSVQGLLIDDIEITAGAGTPVTVENGGFELNSADISISNPSLLIADGETVNVASARAEGGWLSWAVRDEEGVQSSAGEVLFEGANASIPVPTEDHGFFVLDITAHVGGKVIERSTPFGVVPVIDAAQRGTASKFGIHLHDLNTSEKNSTMIDQLAAMGFGYVRADTVWSTAEPKPGEYAFTGMFAENMDSLERNGMHALQVPVYSNKHYDGGKTPSSPEGLAAYGNYVAAILAQHPATGVDVEVYNEFDHFYNTGACGPTPACYIAMLQAVDAAAPEATLVGPSLSGMGFKWEWLEEFFALGGLQYLDAVTAHPYTQPLPAGSMGDDIARLRAMMDASGGADKPIWLTEMGWSTMDDWVTDEEQAKYLVQSTAATLGNGAERFYWYEAADQRTDPTGGEVSMGMFESDNAVFGRGNAPKRAAVAQVVLTDLIGASEKGTVEDIDPAIESYVFGDGDGAIRVIWAPESDTEVTIESKKPVSITDIYGAVTELTPKKGVVSIPLTDEPVYLSGELSVTASD